MSRSPLATPADVSVTGESSAASPSRKARAKSTQRAKQPVNGALGRSVSVIDAAGLPWRAAGKEGLSLKVVREDPAKGLFLGAVAFEPMARSGLHQHQGVATSFVARGGLTDYSGNIRQHEVGINLKGSTHDAIAYESTLLISRLEGPVTYPQEAGDLHGLHIGARHATVRNDAPDVPPEINVPIFELQPYSTGVSGFERRTAFDYAGTGDDHRMLYWKIRPGSVCPRFVATSLIEIWVYGGDLHVNDQAAHANCYIIIEPGQEVSLGSRFGAAAFVWVEGAPTALEGVDPKSLFGY